MPLNNRTRKNGRARNNNARSEKLSSTRKMLRGHELKVPSLPPEFTSRPWFNLTVAIAQLPATVVSTTSLINALSAQIGIVSAQEIGRIELRLYNVRVWGPLVAFTAGAILQPIIVTILDPLAPASTPLGATRTLEEFTRYPDQVRRASIGYRYPIAQSDLVVQQVNPVSLLSYNAAAIGGVAYFQLSWRFDLST
jgi:hypothetical protein